MLLCGAAASSGSHAVPARSTQKALANVARVITAESSVLRPLRQSIAPADVYFDSHVHVMPDTSAF